MNKKVSVVVPVYNVANVLSQCIDSILAQTYQDLELILIDDGSTDNSAVICKDYVLKNPQIFYYYQSNKGVSAARNLGIEKAEGEYISFVDSDDYIEPRLLEEQIAIIENTQADLVIFGYYYDVYKNNGKVYSNLHQVTTDFFDEKEKIVQQVVVMKENMLVDSVWNKIYRLDIIKEQHLLMPVGEKYEDLEFVFRYLPFVQKMHVDQRCYYHYLQRDIKRITNSFDPNKFEFLKKRVKTMRDYILKQGGNKILLSKISFWVIRYAFSSIYDLYNKDYQIPAAERNKCLQAIINDEEAALMAQDIDLKDITRKTDRMLVKTYRSKSLWKIKLVVKCIAFIKFKLKNIFVRIR